MNTPSPKFRALRLVILPICLSTLVISGFSCASQTKLSASARRAIAQRHEGRELALRVSCYYGDLYDENALWLLSPYRFGDVHHIEDLSGNPIHPQNQRGIVPAGTRLLVEKIEFPNAATMAKRMLTTPRYNPWLYLRPAPGQKDIPADKPLILLLPMDLSEEAQVERALGALLGEPAEVRAWLDERRPTVQVAIAHKDFLEGMNIEELVAAAGIPHRWFQESTAQGPARVAWYPSREAWFVEGKLVKVAEARTPEEGVNTGTGP